MNKLSVIGLESEKMGLLTELQSLGLVEMNDQSDKLTDADWSKMVRKDSDEDQVSKLESRLAEAELVLNTAAKFDTEKKPLFFSRKPLTEEEYTKILGDETAAVRLVEDLSEKISQYNDLKTEENTIVSAQASLMPWTSYELPLDQTQTRSVRVLAGVIPAAGDAEGLKAAVAQVSQATDVNLLGSDAEQQYLSVMCLKTEEDQVLDALKSYGFTIMNFKGMSGTAAENMTRLAERLTQVLAEQKNREKEFSLPADEKELIHCYYDSLSQKLTREKAGDKILATKKAFYFDGWAPAEEEAAISKALEAHGCWYEWKEPEKDEDTPVLMKNNSFFYPVQVITELYSLPSSREIDPTPIFAIFYIAFFGMMFADIGYGILLAGLCGLALVKYKPEGLAYRLLKTLVYCGVSTAIWGVLFGGFFGDILPFVKPLWMNPLDNAMFILAFSCILGVVHLFIGMGIKAYLEIRDGHFFDACCDVFCWYVFIIGLGLLLFGESYIGQGAGTIGKYMAIVGAAFIVGCELVRGKGIGKLVGLWNLYGVTSYLADILSYSRLLALGLASAVIAQVFNMLARMVGTNVIGIIAAVLIMVIGHVVNFLINALGSFVHASRLQYVEFFGKFYEGGGVAFKPFDRNTKYVRIVKEDK